MVYVGIGSGFFYALSARDGKQLWRFYGEDSSFNSSPVIVNRMIYAADGDYVYAFATSQGS